MNIFCKFFQFFSLFFVVIVYSIPIHAEEIYMTCGSGGNKFILGADVHYETIWSKVGILSIFHQYQKKKNNDDLPIIIYLDTQQRMQFSADFKNKTISRTNDPTGQTIFCQ